MNNKDYKNRTTPHFVEDLAENEIFVFGSNLAGMHGGGAARIAFNKFGAIWGQGVGIQGQSYGIPTMHGELNRIQPYIDEFVIFAEEHPNMHFLVTRIGCGIAGFKDEEIAPLFHRATNLPNISLPQSFWNILINIQKS